MRSPDNTVVIPEGKPLKVKILREHTPRVTISVGNGGASPEYRGEYSITPKAHDDQVVPCKGYRMSDNVTVRKVPYFETSNHDGQTVYIASEA